MEPFNSTNMNEYAYSICEEKEERGWTWQDVADHLNQLTGNNFSSSYYRRHHKNNDFDLEDSETANEEIQKVKIKSNDEKSELRAQVRRVAREETLVEIAELVASKLYANKLLPDIKNIINTGTTSAILQLSDWHYGIDINNPWNRYNPEIAKERLLYLRDRVVDKCKQNQVNTIYIVNLGDLISGRIHETIRIQNRIDVISQTLEVAEILAEFMISLLDEGFNLKYISCSDNHSRLEPKKDSSLDLESLTRVIDKILSLMLKDRVTFLNSPYGEDIAAFDVDGYRVGAVHGHKDSPKNVVSNLTLMTRKAYDLILTAHLHHFSAEELHEVPVVSNGSLMGVDDYAQQLRVASKPSQTLIICSKESVIEDICRINLY